MKIEHKRIRVGNSVGNSDERIWTQLQIRAKPGAAENGNFLCIQCNKIYATKHGEFLSYKNASTTTKLSSSSVKGA